MAEEIHDVLRIENVETQATERITANDEDRQRQGFDIQTTFAWPERDGVLDVTSGAAADAEGVVLTIEYAPGAEISRVNKGLRRRKTKSIFGFDIDPSTGRWGKVGTEDDTPDVARSQRVVPIVRDNKNAALLRLGDGPLHEVSMTTLQHALARGIELEFQLESSEIQTEPTPSREMRKAILAFEAAEGGAGVLGRLTSDPRALSRVAKTALSLMHYCAIDHAVETVNPGDLEPTPDLDCVKGCYRCLLSYHNQPEHELIDRRDTAALTALLRLARSTTTLEHRRDAGEDRSEGYSLDGLHNWFQALARWGVPVPDAEPLSIEGAALPMVWRAFLVVAVATEPSRQIETALTSAGYLVVRLPLTPGITAPATLLQGLGLAA